MSKNKVMKRTESTGAGRDRGGESSSKKTNSKSFKKGGPGRQKDVKLTKIKTRKLKRKELRKKKKAGKNEFVLKKYGKEAVVESGGKKKKGKAGASQGHGQEGQSKGKADKNDGNDLKAALDLEEKNLKKEMEEIRRKRFAEENIEEDRIINSLQKRLKLNKKSKIPASFRADGLDYVLELCDNSGDKKKRKDSGNVENSDNDNEFGLGDSDEQDFDSDNGGEEAEENDDISEFESDVEDEQEEGLDSEEMDGESENESELESGENEVEELKMQKKKGKKDKKESTAGIWEDIYGRMRTKDGGYVDKSEEPQSISATGSYVPPMKRGNLSSNQLIIKSLKGLLNRLSESNMHSIAQQVEDLYMKNSRNEMNESLLELLFSSLVKKTLMPERIILEHMLLITILHANIGCEIGAFFIQNFVTQFKEKYDSTDDLEDNKEIQNVLLLIVFIYHFKVVDSCLIFDILKSLTEEFSTFSTRDVELILTVLKTVGFRLRKDDPLGLKEFIIILQKKASDSSKIEEIGSRLKFMLEIVTAIKNNNLRKIPNYDPSFGEHLLKIMKSFFQKGNYISELKISMQDLLNAKTKGKWWIVGSAWTNEKEAQEKDASGTTGEIKSNVDDKLNKKLLLKAKSQGMNTDTRKNIFIILMTSEDYLDAFEKLTRLGLKGPQEREIIHVIVYCCLQEKKFNPYYAFIASKFCSVDRRFMYSIGFKNEVVEISKILGQRSASRLFCISQKQVFTWTKQYEESKIAPDPPEESNKLLKKRAVKKPISVDSNTNTKAINDPNISSKSLKQIHDYQVEKDLLNWIKSQESGNLTSILIRKKALDLYRAKGHNDIRCSYGWFRRFKKRFNVSTSHFEEFDSIILSWLLAKYDNNSIVSYAKLREKAKIISQEQQLRSTGWAIRFIKRHHLLVNLDTFYDHDLPSNLQLQVTEFLKNITLPENLANIVCMDEIPLNFSSCSTMTFDNISNDFTDTPASFEVPEKKSRLRKTSIKNCDATIILSLTANGIFLQPMVILKGQKTTNLNQLYIKNDNPIIVYYNENTTPSINVLEKWLDHILTKSIQVQNNSSKVLLWDSYDLHEKMKEKCEAIGINSITFPPGCSLKLQPLNVCAKSYFLKFLEGERRKLIKEKGKNADNKTPSTNDLVDWIFKAYQKTNEMQNTLMESFKIVGITRNEEG